jgi:hypothetical protein
MFSLWKMPSRPLHRWKTFWLGLLVLIFLGWSWWASMNQIVGVTWASSNGVRQLQLFNYDAMAGCWIGDDGYRRTAGFHWDQRKYETEEKEDGIWFQPGVALTEQSGNGVKFAHWFLILLFLVSWAGFLLWRVRRMRPLREMQPTVEDGALP